MNDILREQISDLINNGRAVIAIDGNCASGKSTLADEIQQVFGGTVINADSFFLPLDMRTDERLSEPGGNFHRERFISEVVCGIKSESAFNYGVFDCSVGEVTHSITVDENRLIIIEGSYCMHPMIGFDYDLKIFCTTDSQTQLSRIVKRNGEEMAEVFKAKWIPLENRYFDFYNIKNNCDLIIVT